MSAPDVISHSHGARVDTRMHRPSVILADLDADEYGAPEGGRLPEAESAPVPRIPRERKASSLIGPVMGVAVVVLVALGSCVAQVAK